MDSQIIEAGSLLNFTSFSNLPRELRLLIWKKTLPGPRVFEVKHHPEASGDYRPILQEFLGFNCHIPGELMACRESREELRKVYNIAFRGMSQDSLIHVNPSTDTIVIARLMSSWQFDRTIRYSPFIHRGGGILRSIENICLHFFDLSIALNFIRFVSVFNGYEHIKTIILAMESEETYLDASSPHISRSDDELGQAWFEDAHYSEEDQQQCNHAISGFSIAYTVAFPTRVVPTLKVMALRRRKIPVN